MSQHLPLAFAERLGRQDGALIWGASRSRELIAAQGRAEQAPVGMG